MKEVKKILLRLDAETAQEVKNLAEKSERSINQQINYLLKQIIKINK